MQFSWKSYRYKLKTALPPSLAHKWTFQFYSQYVGDFWVNFSTTFNTEFVEKMSAIHGHRERSVPLGVENDDHFLFLFCFPLLFNFFYLKMSIVIYLLVVVVTVSDHAHF